MWEARARTIEDVALREDALRTLHRKRGSIDGAGLFWTLADRRDPRLLRALVAHELIWDFLDCVSERGAEVGDANGLQLHRALADSLDPDAPMADYYRHHRWRRDTGFLRELVGVCRASCVALPSYGLVRSAAVDEARRGAVQGLNHALDAKHRDEALRSWVRSGAAPPEGVDWFELTAAESASLVIHALLALSASPNARVEDVAAVRAAYFPWVSLATVMLDSYVDQIEDAATGSHSYIAHYRDKAAAVSRLHETIERAGSCVLGLPDGNRHAVIVACMVAMYLSKDSASAPELRATTGSLVAAGGSLTRLLVPVLRLWRIRHEQQAW
jgi:tetraprenyl-beta-curcumene synthase